jgi:hypothetical protein
MRAIDAESQLRQLLEAQGIAVRADGPDLVGDGRDWRGVWGAFCELARIPADEPFDKGFGPLHVPDDSDCDLLLHESGAVGEARDRFEVSIRRQFSFAENDGEYAGMNHLMVTFECDRLPEGRVPQAQRWGYAGTRRPDVSDEAHPEGGVNWAGYLDSWANAAEASLSFKVLEELGPVRWTAGQEDM